MDNKLFIKMDDDTGLIAILFIWLILSLFLHASKYAFRRHLCYWYSTGFVFGATSLPISSFYIYRFWVILIIYVLLLMTKLLKFLMPLLILFLMQMV